MVHNNLILIFCVFIAGCAFINGQQNPAAGNVDLKQENFLKDQAAAVGIEHGAGASQVKTAQETETENAVVAEVKGDVPVTKVTVNVDATTPNPNVTTTSSSTSTTSTTPSTTTTTTTKSTTSTTTTASTTSTTTTTSTTMKPTTTTKVPPTPAPGPVEPPHIGQWNSSCIIVKMAAQLNFTYVTKDNKNATILYNIPTNATVNDVECNSTTHQSIDLNWGPKSSVNMMLLLFSLNNKTVSLSQILITLNLDEEHFPNAKENQTIQLVHRGSEFKTPLQMSYHCTRNQMFNLTETVNNKNVTGTIDMSDVQMEAFRHQNSTQFSTVHDCDDSGISDVVPIAVGLALVSLILIVLIAYLCARRRSILRGYMSF